MTVGDEFQQFEADLAAGGAEGVFELLAARFAKEKKYHELFDTRLAQSRHRLGLSLHSSASLEELPEPQRSQLEEGYLAACREVGQMLLDAGSFRQAWMYLRPAGELPRMRAALNAVDVTDENLQELVEVALYEGIAPELGYGLILSHHGTCNAITTFETVAQSLDMATQRRLAALLLKHLHAELMTNLRSDLVKPEDEAEPAASSVAELLAGIEGTFGEFYCHIDASHLGAVVRYARLLTNPDELSLALDLTEYGRRLHENFRSAGEEPFVDLFAHHGLFFAAQLGRQVNEALAHFRARAQEVSIYDQGTAAVETYAILLTRLGRFTEAMAALALVPGGIPTSRFAPSLMDLSARCGEFRTLQEIYRQRGDLLGFALARLEEQRRASGST